VAALGGSFDKEMKTKVENDAAAFARTIAASAGATSSGRKGRAPVVSATEREAVRLHVVDLIADSTTDLLDKLDGRVVKTPTREVVLHTRGAAIQPIGIGFRDRVLNIITDPNVAYVLMMLGCSACSSSFRTPE